MAWIAPGDERQVLMKQLPGIGDRFEGLYAAFWRLPQLPAATLELCRLRLAQLHRSERDWATEEVAVPRAQRDELRQWPDSPHFDAPERACNAWSEIDPEQNVGLDPDLVSPKIREMLAACAS